MTVGSNDTLDNKNQERLVLTVEEVAKELRIGRNSAYELVYRKDFPAFRVGKKILVPYSSLCDWVLNQCKVDSNIARL